MKIGIAGPVSTESIKDLLKGDISTLPKGFNDAPFLAILIKSLIKLGHQVSVYTLDFELPPEQLNPIFATGPNFKIYYSPCRKHSVRPNGKYLGRSLDFFYREIKALTIAINIDQPDIVNGHWSYEYGLAAVYSNKPYVVTCHDSPLKILKYMFNYYRFGRLLMAIWLFNKAKALTAVSPYLKSEIAKFTNANIDVIPNSTPIQHIQDRIDTAINLNAPKIVMLLNGFGPLKNAKPAMQAFNQVLNSKPNATLHIFGYDFETDGPAQKWAKANHIDHNINYHGPTPHNKIIEFLKDATLLLHPSLEESLSMCSIEAMSLGKPVIGGKDSGGLPWVLDFGKAGILANVKNPNDIAHKILMLINDQTLYIDYSNKSLNRVKQVFTKDKVAKAYEETYLKILNNY